MEWILPYLCVAAYFHGEFNGRAHAKGTLTVPEWCWNVLAAMLWPFGLIVCVTPRRWWNWVYK